MKQQFAAAFTSLACTVHCMATPFLMAAGSHASLAVPHWASELVVFGLLPLLAVYLLGKDFRRHRKPLPLMLWGLGFLISAGSHLAELHSLHLAASLLAAGFMLLAFYNNHRRVRCCAVA